MHLLGLLYLSPMSDNFSLIPCPSVFFSTSLGVISCVLPYLSQRFVTMSYGFLPPSPVSLPGKVHGQRNLADCSPWGCKGTDVTAAEHAYGITFASVFISFCLLLF